MRKLKVYLQNVRGLNTKIKSGFRDRSILFNYDIYAITESWLQANIESSELFDAHYVVHRADRMLNESVQRGGGVLLAIKKNISATRILNWEKEVPFENVWIKINKENGKKMFINVIYLKPGFKTHELKKYLDHISDIIISRETNAEFIIMGDFNMSCISWELMGEYCEAIEYEGNCANELLYMLNLTNMLQRNSIKNKYNKSLDLVISNINVKVIRATEVLVYEDDYHPSLSLEIDSNNIKFLKANKTPKRNFHRANYDLINNDLSMIKWENELNMNNIDIATNKYYEIINGIIKKHVPLSSPKNNEYPIWFSNKLKELIKAKEYFRKLMKRNTNNEIYTTLFKLKRHEIKVEKKKSYSNYIKNTESLITKNPKSFFSYTKSIKKNNKLPNAMFLKETSSEDSQTICNLFAKQFASVYTDSINDQRFVCNENCGNYLRINNIDIIKSIESFDANKSNSPDLIPMLFYHQTAEYIATPLKFLFDLSTKTMNYPTPWKVSYISPIYKSGDSSNIENYRPVSVISAISKIFERLLFNHIFEKTSHLISNKQHGFITGRSTLTNLLEYNDYVSKNMTRGSQVDTVYTDMAKAFDKIDHNLLLKKLSKFPLSKCLIKLLESFLRERKQIICLYGIRSGEITPNSSVPQGSVLSPLLFALFMNDLPDSIKSEILMFADDVKIFRKIMNLNDARLLQNDINEIAKWCMNNRLSLNTNKCYVMSTTRKLNINVHCFSYNINGTPLIRVDSFRDLGVIFDSKHTFESHINLITSKSFKMLGFISRSLNKFKNMKTYLILYNTYVRSIIEYCSAVWSPQYITYIEKLERVQKLFTRILFKKFHFATEEYNMRLLRLEMISLQDRRSINDEIVFYKLINRRFNTTLSDRITIRNININLRRFIQYYPPFSSTNIEYHSALNRMQRNHDELYMGVNIHEDSLNAFKRYIYHETNLRQPIRTY